MLRNHSLIVRRLGRVPYAETVAAMKAFTEARTPDTPDELWRLEHESVYTLGLRCRARAQPESPMGSRRGPRAQDGAIAASLHGIPLVQTDRGGDITWHGPGQLVLYTLFDLARLGIGIRTLVNRLEQSVIDLLSENDLRGERRTGAPGIYVGGAKIAALGLRIRRGATYHGLSFNVNPDLTAFSRIDPCGYPGLSVTSLEKLGLNIPADDVAGQLMQYLSGHLGYTARVPTIPILS